MGKYRQLLTERYPDRVPRMVADPEKDEGLCKAMIDLMEAKQKIQYARRLLSEKRRSRREQANAEKSEGREN